MMLRIFLFQTLRIFPLIIAFLAAHAHILCIQVTSFAT